MKTTLALSLSSSSRALLIPGLALALSLDTASAQQSANYAPPAGYRQQPGYGGYQPQRPNVGERVGGFVKRLFYGEPQAAYPQPQYNSGYQSGRSLDAPPAATRRSVPTYQSSNASKPPAPLDKPTPTSKPKVTKKPETSLAKTASSKYTPPRIKPESSAPKSEPKPAPQKVEEQPPAPAPTPTRTEPAPYTPPSPQDTPPVIDNKPSEAPTTLASLNSSQPNAVTSSTTPTPPVQETQSTPKETPVSNSTSGQFLIGKKTATPGRVISPYPPYQELDVSGLSSGSLALDPTTDKVFQIP